jgi:hypothetical protein
MDDTPHTIVVSKHQHRLYINVWVGILNDQLLGPVVLPNRLTGAVHHWILVTDLPVLLEDAPLHQQHMWFMHDGASSRFLRTVRQHLNQTFSEQWLRRAQEQSADLNPLVS